MKRVCLNAPHRRGIAAVLLFFLEVSFSQPAFSLPSDPTIETGSVSSENLSPEHLHFHVDSEKAVLNFDSFDIAAPETVDFHHHALSPENSVLSRVTGGEFSTIAGTLTSNGQLLLVNPAGVAIAPTANIQAASFIASTLQIDTPDFLEGKLQFRQDGKMPPAAILNQGKIMSSPGGLVALLGSTVVNEGSIVAQVGKVVLAAGERMTLSLDPRGELAVLLEETPPSVAASLEGGQVLVQAKDLPRIFDRLVNSGQIAEAVAVVEQAGKIHLVGEAGTLRHSGTIQADAREFGDGGRVLLQSEKATQVLGEISARGGRQGGSGGFVDTSSRGDLQVETGPDLSASFGHGGLWLLDPRNIEITTTTSNTTESGGDPDLFTPTANNAKVNVSAINTALNNGTSVTVNTGSTGGQPGNITVNAAISKTSGGAATLLLTAANNITVNNTISSISDLLHVTFRANDNSSGGGDVSVNAAITTNGGAFTATGQDFSSDTSGTITTAGGALSISHTRDVASGGALSSAAGAVDMDAGRDIDVTAGITTTTGDISMDATGSNSDIDLRASVTSTSGDVTLRAVRGVALSTASADVATGGTYTVNADTDADGFGDYSQSNSGSAVTITNTNGTVSITADDIALTGTLDSGSGNVSLLPSTSVTVGLGTGAGTFNLTDSELDNVTTTGALTIGNNSSSAITLDDLTLGAKNITLVSGSTINDDDDAGSALTTTGALTLTAGGSIGNLGGAAGLNINVGSLAVTSASGINITQDAGNLILGSLTATGGISLGATTGSILDDNGGLANLTAGGNSLLTASGVIGTISDPLDVTVSGATLSVGPSGQVNGVSAVLSGSVAPSGTLGLIGTLLGQVIFNDQIIFEPPLTPGTLNTFFGQVLSFLFAPESQRRARSLAA